MFGFRSETRENANVCSPLLDTVNDDGQRSTDAVLVGGPKIVPQNSAGLKTTCRGPPPLCHLNEIYWTSFQWGFNGYFAQNSLNIPREFDVKRDGPRHNGDGLHLHAVHVPVGVAEAVLATFSNFCYSYLIPRWKFTRC